MTAIDQVRGKGSPETATRLRLAQIAVYLVVIATGLAIGAFIGLVLALFSGLISINC